MFALAWDTPTILGLLAIPALVALNGFFVAAEFALVAVRKTRVEELVNEGRVGAKALAKALDNLNDSVAASQLGITLASLALGFVSEPAVAKVLSPLFETLPASLQGTFAHTLSVIVTLSLVTYLHVVFGEQTPKIAALQGAEQMGLRIAPPMNVFAKFSRPLIRLMNGSSQWLLRRCGYAPPGPHAEAFTVNELRLLVEDTEEAGLLDADQADVVLKVFALNDRKVKDCLVPKNKVTMLDVRATREVIRAAIRDGAHTRMPVWEDKPDNIIGVVNTKELFHMFTTNLPVVLDDLLYPPTFLAPDETVANALTMFRKAHKHMAIVRDSNNVVLGILTLEDVVEQIVGDIEDEHDVRVSKLVRIKKR